MVSKLQLILFLLPAFANAANIVSVQQTNPANVVATLEVSCERAVENFEKTAAKYFGSLPYVSDVVVMSKSDWKEDSKTDAATVSVKHFNFSINPSLTKEFPTMFMPITIRRNQCNPPKPGATTTCTSMYTLAIEGSKGVVYQKVNEATKNQNYLKSFMGTMIFQVAGENSCTLNNQLYIADNSYLWAKRHLIKDINPTLIETEIFARFIDWAKSGLPTLEGK